MAKPKVEIEIDDTKALTAAKSKAETKTKEIKAGSVGRKTKDR